MSYRLPLYTAVATFMLMILGGLVVGLNAGFACPDWPLCGGKVIPPLEGPVLVEYFHRLVTTVLSVLIVATLVVAWRRRRSVHRWVPTLAILAFVFLLAQIVLGAVIVVFVLPGAFTTIDVANSMGLLATYVVWTAVCLPSTGAKPGTGSLLVPATVTSICVFSQIVLGGFFRHSGAGEALFGQSGYLASHHETNIPSKIVSTALLEVHILVAVLATACVIWLFIESLRKRTSVFAAASLLILTLLQMVLGIASLATSLELYTTTAHWADSALMLSVAVFMAAKARLADLGNEAGLSREKRHSGRIGTT